MNEVSFTAGITLQNDRVMTVDVTALDEAGIAYKTEQGEDRISWSEVKAVMLATTDHMLESAGSLFSMAERIQVAGDESSAAEMHRFGLGLLQQVAPRICPMGEQCGLRPHQPPAPEPRQA